MYLALQNVFVVPIKGVKHSICKCYCRRSFVRLVDLGDMLDFFFLERPVGEKSLYENLLWEPPPPRPLSTPPKKKCSILGHRKSQRHPSNTWVNTTTSICMAEAPSATDMMWFFCDLGEPIKLYYTAEGVERTSCVALGGLLLHRGLLYSARVTLWD